MEKPPASCSIWHWKWLETRLERGLAREGEFVIWQRRLGIKSTINRRNQK
jgi:hypothetical protein